MNWWRTGWTRFQGLWPLPHNNSPPLTQGNTASQKRKFQQISSFGQLDMWACLTSYCFIQIKIKQSLSQIILQTSLVVPVFHSCVSKQVVQRGASPCGVQIRDELWLAGCADDTLPAHHYSVSPRGGTMAGLQPHCGRCSWSRGEGWLSGEHHTGPTLDLAPRCCAVHCSWLWGPSWQHLPQRLDHLPWAWGGGWSVSSLARSSPPLPQTWTWAVVQRQMQRTQPRHNRSCWGLVVVSCVRLCISCRVINACCSMPRNKVLACEFTDSLIEVLEGIWYDEVEMMICYWRIKDGTQSFINIKWLMNKMEG